MGDIKMAISTARKEFNQLPEMLAEQNGMVEVTKRGKSVLAILPWEAYDAIRETLEIVGDQELMKKLRQSIREAREGKLIPWEEAEKEL
jgi:antitoxin YefM